MIRRSVITVLLVACQQQPAKRPTLHAELVHSATQEWGVQRAGEDAGTFYGFVKVDSPRATKLAITSLALRRGATTCAAPTSAFAIDRISPVTDAYRALTLVALADGTPYDGQLDAGTTYLRVHVTIDHACPGNTEPVVELRLDDNGTPIVLAKPLAERMPS